LQRLQDIHAGGLNGGEEAAQHLNAGLLEFLKVKLFWDNHTAML
jgi:hypothetical protein